MKMMPDENYDNYDGKMMTWEDDDDDGDND